MFRLRRTSTDLRLDITPMLDVVFLLLTFFLFAFVVVERARTLDVDLPDTGRADRSAERAIITVSLTDDRRLAIDGDLMSEDGAGSSGGADPFALMTARVQELLDRQPDARVILAADQSAPSGDLLELIDALTNAGVTEFSVLGRAEGVPGEPDAGATP